MRPGGSGVSKATATIRTHNMFVDMGRMANELQSWVGIGPAYAEGQPQPPLLAPKLLAVWDTGATSSAISRQLAQRLQLDEIGQMRVHGATGCEVCTRFLVSLHLPNRVVIRELEISDCGGDIGCDILLGMDVITLGDFAICNYKGHTTFTFRVPSVESLDFTTQLAHTAARGTFFAVPKIGRNAPCPCGSGQKYKKCCGK